MFLFEPVRLNNETRQQKCCLEKMIMIRQTVLLLEFLSRTIKIILAYTQEIIAINFDFYFELGSSFGKLNRFFDYSNLKTVVLTKYL